MSIVRYRQTVRRKFIDLPVSLPGPSQVKIGFMHGNPNVDKAVWNEFGTRGSGKGFKSARGGGFGKPIPERPFMRNAMAENEGKYQKQMLDAAKALIEGRATLTQVMDRLGIQGVQDVQASITALQSPPNSALTIALKGSSNPLIDTGDMRQSVTFEVKD